MGFRLFQRVFFFSLCNLGLVLWVGWLGMEKGGWETRAEGREAKGGVGTFDYFTEDTGGCHCRFRGWEEGVLHKF